MNRGIAEFIDHTFLKSAGAVDQVEKLCAEAKKYRFASVCVNPAEVEAAARRLRCSEVKVCTVIDFPLGASTLRARCFEALDAVQKGADELDLVVNQRLLKYAPRKCEAELLQWVRTCRTLRSDLVLKLILECCNLTRKEIVAGCRIAKRVGFDFVKTSTGFGSGGATVEDVTLMRRTVGPEMGVKASGGIRDRASAEKFIKAGANRIGTSNGVEIASRKAG
jgi:deoxyribose-phosphate aldolase